MAMSTDKKLYIAVGVLAALGLGVYLQKKAEKREAATYTLAGQQAKLPSISVSEEEIKKIDKIEIDKPPGDAGAAEKVVLVKKGDEDWALTEPVEFKANYSNIKSALNNLKSLKVQERISPSKDSYGRYELADGKALHVTIFKGKEKVVDLYVGESGSRGQMVRFAERDGVYALGGFSRYLFARELKNWRDRTIFKFEEDEVASVEIENENGVFEFTRDESKADKKDAKKKAGDKDKKKAAWIGKSKKTKAGALAAIKDFKSDKVNDLLRAYKSLNGLDFGDDKKLADIGLSEPAATLTIKLKDGAQRVLLVGSNAEGSNRWAKKGDSDEIYTVSSYVADWATAEASKFEEKKKDDKDKKKDTDTEDDDEP